MKSVSNHVKKKFKTVEDIVHGHDFVVVAARLLRNYIIKQLLTIEALDMM